MGVSARRTSSNVGLGREDNRNIADHVKAFCEWARRAGTASPATCLRSSRDMPTSCTATRDASPPGTGSSSQGTPSGLAYDRSGEGIRPAVESAVIAAEVIAGAGGSFDETTFAGYERRLRERFRRARNGNRTTTLDPAPPAARGRDAAPRHRLVRSPLRARRLVPAPPPAPPPRKTEESQEKSGVRYSSRKALPVAVLGPEDGEERLVPSPRSPPRLYRPIDVPDVRRVEARPGRHAMRYESASMPIAPVDCPEPWNVRPVVETPRLPREPRCARPSARTPARFASLAHLALVALGRVEAGRRRSETPAMRARHVFDGSTCRAGRVECDPARAHLGRHHPLLVALVLVEGERTGPPGGFHRTLSWLIRAPRPATKARATTGPTRR